MAIILKPTPNGADKGVILLSHRELGLFKLASHFAPQVFKGLVESYSFILHIGWYHKKFTSPAWLSCVMTSPGNIGRLERNGVRYENICSRDVLPEVFSLRSETERRFDCAYVCNNSKNKRAREFFELVKVMPHRKFLLILSYPECADPVKFDNELIAEIKAYQERVGSHSNLAFIDAKQGPRGYALSRAEIAEYLRESRLYVHLCRREGESRSLGEALACGCFLALHKDFIGGATDLCTGSNSFSFNAQSDLVQSVDETLNRGIQFHANANEYETIRSNTLERLRLLLADLGLNAQEISDLFIQDLSMVLPGHVPSKLPGSRSTANSDIIDADEFSAFCKDCGITTSALEVQSLRIPLALKGQAMKWISLVRSRKVF